MNKVLFSQYFTRFRISRLSKAAVFFLVLVISVLAWRSINYVSGAAIDQDSGVFSSGGFFLLEGETIYKNFWDHKPPMVHFLNAAAMAIGGRSINSVRMMERCFAVFGGLSFFFIVYLLLKNVWLSFFSSLFYVMYFFRPGLLENGNLTEEYGAAFVLGGILFAVISNETKAFSFVSNFISGTFFSAAFFMKEPFLFSAIPWFLYLILYKDRIIRNVFMRAFVFISGAVLVFAVILFYLIINSAFKNWIDVLSFNRVYVSMANEIFTIPKRISLNYRQVNSRIFRTTFIAGLFAFAGLFSVLQWSFVKKYKYLPLLLISFFVMDFCGTMIAAKAYGHYYLQLAASYILLGVIGVEFLLSAFKKSRLVQLTFVLAVLMSFSVDRHIYREYKKYLMMPSEKVTPDKIAEYIKANGSQEDTIWITSGKFSRYYIESERLSPTKYYYMADHFFVDTYLDTAEEKIEGIKEDLRRNPPKFIVTGINNVKIVKRAGIQDWIDENYYELPVSTDGAAVLLVLKSSAEPSEDE